MSFFIKGKQSGKINKFNGKKRKVAVKPKKPTKQKDDEEISSEEDEFETKQSQLDVSSSEDERETAQEKKLRLAQFYLKEIAKEEQSRLEDGEPIDESNDRISGDPISKRLKEDYLRKAGKLRLNVADQYDGADVDGIVNLRCKEHYQSITCLCLSTDNYLFSGSKDGAIVKWSLSELHKVASIPFNKANFKTKDGGHTKSIMSIAICYDNKFLVVGDQSNEIKIWDPNNFKYINSLKGHRDGVTGVVFRLNTHTLYSCSKDRSVKVWSLDEMSYVETLYGHQDMITSIDALARERAVTAGGTDVSIRLWKIADESQLVYNGDYGSVDVVRLINEDHFVSGGDDGSLSVWSVLKKKPLCTQKEAHGHDTITSQPYWICSIACVLNSDLIASGSYDGTIKLWKIGDNYRSINLLSSIDVQGFVNCLGFSGDGRMLIAGVGSESKFGRWTVIKQIKSRVIVVPLLQKN